MDILNNDNLIDFTDLYVASALGELSIFTKKEYPSHFTFKDTTSSTKIEIDKPNSDTSLPDYLAKRGVFSYEYLRNEIIDIDSRLLGFYYPLRTTEKEIDKVLEFAREKHFTEEDINSYKAQRQIDDLLWDLTRTQREKSQTKKAYDYYQSRSNEFRVLEEKPFDVEAEAKRMIEIFSSVLRYNGDFKQAIELVEQRYYAIAPLKQLRQSFIDLEQNSNFIKRIECRHIVKETNEELNIAISKLRRIVTEFYKNFLSECAWFDIELLFENELSTLDYQEKQIEEEMETLRSRLHEDPNSDVEIKRIADIDTKLLISSAPSKVKGYGRKEN